MIKDWKSFYYSVASLGALFMIVVGLFFSIHAVFQAFLSQGIDPILQQLSIGLTMLLIGLPIFAYYIRFVLKDK